MAWENEPRLQFDTANEPIVMGRTLFVGSSHDGSVRAFDTKTGARRWTFFTEGPIRFAPVGWKNKIYVGSDDGYLYCLNAKTGKELWKVRGAPDDRPDYRQLGNARLVSYWPVRGGAVLHKGIIYFGAGIWPSMGVFVKAVDATTGKVKWSNGEISYIEKVRIDHNDLRESGLSPQGYFLFTDGKLHVPNGRSMPAGFDHKTGKLLQYVQGYRNGDSRVTSSGKLLFVGERGIVNTSDEHEVGDRWKSAGKNAPQGWSTKKRDLFEGPFWGYKISQGCTSRSVFENGIAYGMAGVYLMAHDLNKTKLGLYEKKAGKYTYHPAKWEAAEVWKKYYIAKGDKRGTPYLLKAGNRIYTHVGKLLVAVDLPSKKGGKPKTVWKRTLDGTPASIIAANGNLFVSLTNGKLLCFGRSKKRVAKYKLPTRPLKGKDDLWKNQATYILEQSKVKEGYCLIAGIQNEQLIEELLNQSKMKLIIVDKDRKRINKLKQKLIDAKLYGSRAEAFTGDPATFRFPNYLAHLIILKKGDSQLSSKQLAKHYKTLRPYGGVLWFSNQGLTKERLKKMSKQAKLAKAKISQESQFVSLRKVGPLPGSANWTHEGGDAARTYYSRDDLVRAPLSILWYGDGKDHGFNKYKDYGRGVKPHVAGGRLFAFDDKASKLTGIDAYTGRWLWSFETKTPYVRYVSRVDGVYVGRNEQCDILDPATGKVKKTYRCRLQQKKGRVWGVVDVRVTEKIVLMAFGYALPVGHSHQAVTSGLWDSEALVAMDKKTGKQLWVKYPRQRYNIHAIALGERKVFVTDSIRPSDADKLKRRGKLPKKVSATTYAFNELTGRTIWKKTIKYDYFLLTNSHRGLRANDHWVSYSVDHKILLSGIASATTARVAATGKKLWKKRAGLQPIIVREKSFINQAGNRYLITTGNIVNKKTIFKIGGCNYAVGNKHLLLLRNKCASYVDLKSQKEYSLRNLRSGCSNSFVAADGLLNIPSFSTGCVCNYPLQTSFAMHYMPESAKWIGEKPFRLIKEK
ncbi:hypothetical protein MNBD_PLANCTO02-2185 [hydrothermal vent metagenome]|uniref:Pyrrolo-quinoline quinone repeat domain-containing protein n=1 Tax=hydrothermal vent metagenome TaxID=652676 RepID=A0A3B1DWJ6_9ZZZZ